MWQYLSTPENSYVIWNLVKTQWGHQDYESLVQWQQSALTFGVVADNNFVALASVSYGGNVNSGWLHIWSRGKCKMHVWQELYEFLFKELGLQALLAITSRKGLIRYAHATHGEYVATIQDWFGSGEPGYILQWKK